MYGTSRFVFVGLAAVLVATAASAQYGPPAAGMPYAAENIDPAQPFGDIDVAGAGMTADEVRAYLVALTGGQLIEIIQRCAIIQPSRAQVAYNFRDAEANPAAAAGAPQAAVYPDTATGFCTLVNAVVYGDQPSAP